MKDNSCWFLQHHFSDVDVDGNSSVFECCGDKTAESQSRHDAQRKCKQRVRPRQNRVHFAHKYPAGKAIITKDFYRLSREASYRDGYTPEVKFNINTKLPFFEFQNKTTTVSRE